MQDAAAGDVLMAYKYIPEDRFGMKAADRIGIELRCSDRYVWEPVYGCSVTKPVFCNRSVTNLNSIITNGKR